MKRKVILGIFLMFNVSFLSAQNDSTYFAIMQEATTLSYDGKYEQSFREYKKAFALKSVGNKELYAAACAACSANLKEECVDFLKRAIKAGYLHTYWMNAGVGFDILRDSTTYTDVYKAYEEAYKKIELAFDSMQYYEPHNLIPFWENGKWGYMDKISGKIVVKALYDKVSFVANCFIVDYGANQIRFLWNGRLESVGTVGHPLYYDETQPYIERKPKKGIKGFNIDSKGRIVSYADKYQILSNAFRFNNKWVVFALTDKMGFQLIDREEKNILPINRYLKQASFNQYGKDSSFWFFFIDSSNNIGFMSSNGELKLYNEISDYPIYSYDGGRHYSIQRRNNLYGIVDLKQLKWIIEPSYFQIISMGATHTTPCGQYTQDKYLKDVYFLVRENDGNHYYIDVTGKRYIPLK